MRKTQFALVAMTLIGAVGCNESTPGGPGVRNPSGTQSQTVNKPVVGESKPVDTRPVDTRPVDARPVDSKPVVSESRDTFSLRLPALSTSLKQGESKTASISISRGTNFDDDVQLTFSNVPTGITLDPMSPTIAHSDKEVKINVTAADDAAIGEFTVNVNGHPAKAGADATGEFKLKISEKK